MFEVADPALSLANVLFSTSSRIVLNVLPLVPICRAEALSAVKEKIEGVRVFEIVKALRIVAVRERQGAACEFEMAPGAVPGRADFADGAFDLRTRVIAIAEDEVRVGREEPHRCCR